MISRDDIVPGAAFTFVSAGNERVIDLIVCVRYHRCHVLRTFTLLHRPTSTRQWLSWFDVDVLVGAYNTITIDPQRLW